MSHERPTRNQLRDFLVGKVSADEQTAIAAYLDIHPEALDDVADSDVSDSLISDLQQPANAFSGEPAFQRGLAKARTIRLGQVREPIPHRVGPFILLERIDRRGTSTVYKARDDRTSQTVALKVLPTEQTHDSKIIERFRREMESVEKLDHPNIVRFIEAGEADGVLFLAMELLQGFDLSSLVERLGPLPVESACYLGRQTAFALQHAFENGLVHRDVKPSNIFVTDEGDAKLLDLGLARPMTDDEDSFTRSDQLLGTIDYMAPEQAFDTHHADIRSDIYSLGCTLYKLLVGYAPYSGPEYRHLLKKALAHSSQPMVPIRERRPDVPEPLARIIERMCAKQPDDRYQTPTEVADALAPLADGDLLVGLVERAAREPVAAGSTTHADQNKLRTQSNSDTLEIIRQSDPTGHTTWNRWFAVFVLVGVIGICSMFLPSLFTSREHHRSDDDAATLTIHVPVIDISRTRIEQSKMVLSVAVSPDSQFLATGGEDHILRLRRMTSDDAPIELIGHTGKINAVAFSPDGRYFLSAGKDRTLRVWNPSTLREAFVFRIGRGEITAASFTPTSTQVVAADNGGELHVWSLSDGIEIASPNQQKHPTPIEAISIHPDGHLVFTASTDGICRLCDLNSGEILREFEGHTSYVHSVAIAPDGETAISGGDDQTVRIWNLVTGGQIAVFKEHDKAVRAITFSLDGSHVLSADWGGTLHWWDVTRQQVAATFRGKHGILTAVVSPNSQFVAAGTAKGTVLTWEIPPSLQSDKRDNHSSNSPSFAVNEAVLHGDADANPEPAEVAELDRITQDSPDSGIWCISVSSDGQFIRTGSNDGNIRIWNMATKKRVASLRRTEEADHPVHAFAFTPDGSRCLAAGFPPYVALWDIAKQRIVQEFPGHKDRVWTVRFSPDGTKAASAGWDETIRIWNVNTGNEVNVINPGMGKVLSLVYLPDSNHLIAGGRAEVALFNTNTGQRRWTFFGYPLFVNALAVSADGRQIAIAGRDKTLRLLRSQNGEQLRVLEGHTDWVNAVAFSADNRWILSGSADQTVRLWDAKTGKQLRCFKGHDGPINAVAFVATQSLAVSGSDDRTIRVWPLPQTTEGLEIP